MPEERIDEHLDATDEWLATCEREFPVAFDDDDFIEEMD